jgi:tetratricopeptide (TPR) repeat protein
MKAMYFLLIFITLTSCTYMDPEPQSQASIQELSEVILSNYIHPVIAYPEPNEPQVMAKIAEGKKYADSNNLVAAANSYEDAASLVITLDGLDSTMLLAIYDELIELYVNMDSMQQADKLQHRYHTIVENRYKNNNVTMSEADFRIGCWHSMIGDWYEALFDFEEVIKRLDSDPEIQGNEHRQLNHAKNLADIASVNCVPNW